jgi:hypothetical protein
MNEQYISHEQEQDIDLASAAEAAKGIFFNSNDKKVGIIKMILGGTIVLGGFISLVTPIPYGFPISLAGLGLIAEGKKQVVKTIN